MHKHGGDVYTHKNVIDFSANINMMGTPKGVIEAASQALQFSGSYPDTQCRELRDAIGKTEGLPVEYVICGNGAAELIFSVVLATRPKNALLLAPSFYEYQQALEIFEECNISYEMLSESNDFELKESVLDKINNDLDIIFLCNPNNPTGKLIENEILVKVLRKCIENHVLLVLDECFLDMVEDYEKHTMISYIKETENLFILKAFTKMYAMAGIRLGYGLCSNKTLLKRMKAVTQPWSVSVVAQYAGVAALKSKPLVKEFLKILEIERDYLINELTDLNIKHYGYSANYIFFKSHINLYDDCLENGILIRDCSNYIGLEKGYYRIAIKGHADNVKLVEVLRKCI